MCFVSIRVTFSYNVHIVPVCTYFIFTFRCVDSNTKTLTFFLFVTQGGGPICYSGTRSLLLLLGFLVPPSQVCTKLVRTYLGISSFFSSVAEPKLVVTSSFVSGSGFQKNSTSAPAERQQITVNRTFIYLEIMQILVKFIDLTMNNFVL
jgi:hypothetical protein